ncbi:L-seryl-tRNA(Sec) selenium transferase, partial [Pyxidicoccus fallax]|nr:L-seryl-tRNA(Sec) selenium transferase [Pyxidicoccus fallax]
VGQVGGGAMPLARLPSFACILNLEKPETFLDRLRGGDVPVIGRITDGEAVLDVRCLSEEELESVAQAVAAAIPGNPP